MQPALHPPRLNLTRDRTAVDTKIKSVYIGDSFSVLIENDTSIYTAMLRTSPTLTYERLRDLLSYDQTHGLLTWRKHRPGRMRPGDEAGTVNADGLVMVGIDGVMYSAARLAWFYVHEKWPGGRIRFKDGDKQNLRLANLEDEGCAPAPTPAARYQRKWRAERKWVDNKIKSDPRLFRLARDPRHTTAIFNMVRDERRAYLQQNGFTDGYYPPSKPKRRNR